MNISPVIINGNETGEKNKEIQALSAFYKAFNTGSMQLMEKCWLSSAEISMDNPVGGIRRGWDEIANGYKRIFNGSTKVYVEFYDFSIHTAANMFLATGRERGFFRTEKAEMILAIRTSRVFIKHNGDWKQLHHHGSIENPALLAQYQAAVMTAISN